MRRSREVLGSEGLTMGMDPHKEAWAVSDRSRESGILMVFDSRWIGNDHLSGFSG